MAKRIPLSQQDDFPATASLGLTSRCGMAGDENDLLQILLKSASPGSALLQLIAEAGRLLGAEACALGLLEPGQGLMQACYWEAGKPATFSPLLRPLLNVLELPSVRSPLTRTTLLSVSDLPALSQVPSLTLPPEADEESADILHQWLPKPQEEAVAYLTEFPPDIGEAVVWSRPGSILVAKTRFQGCTNGVVVILRSQPYLWTESDMQLLRTLSDQVSIAVSQVQLEQQVQQQICYQSVVDQLTSAVRNAWPLDQIFHLALEGSASALQAERGLVALYKYKDPLHKGRVGTQLPEVRVTVESLFPRRDAEATAGSSPSASGQEDSRSKPSFRLVDCELCQQMLIHPNGAIALPTCSEVRSAPSEVISLKEAARTATVFDLLALPSLLLVPLENQGVVLGILAVQQRQSRIWRAEEVAFLRLMAAQLSTAIIQTRTLRQVNSLVDERTAQLRRSLDVQAKLYEKTRQQVEQLRRLNQIMEEFLSTVSHELLTPLTSMKVAIRMLREANLAPEQRDRYLEILEAQCAQETRLINDLLTLQKLESHSVTVQFQQLDLQYVLRDLQQNWSDSLAYQQSTLEVQMPPRSLMIRTDPDSLNRILTELLTNAKKYSDAGSKIILKASLEKEDSTPQVVLSLSNTGSGIAPEEVPVIFEKFRRGQGATQKAIPGIGLGLALVKGLAAHLSGTIAVTSEPTTEPDLWQTCFTLTLPQSPEFSR